MAPPHASARAHTHPHTSESPTSSVITATCKRTHHAHNTRRGRPAGPQTGLEESLQQVALDGDAGAADAGEGRGAGLEDGDGELGGDDGAKDGEEEDHHVGDDRAGDVADGTGQLDGEDVGDGGFAGGDKAAGEAAAEGAVLVYWGVGAAAFGEEEYEGEEDGGHEDDGKQVHNVVLRECLDDAGPSLRILGRHHDRIVSLHKWEAGIYVL